MIAINRFPNARSQWFRRIAVPHYLREKRRENRNLVSVRVQKRLDRTDDRPDLLSHALSYTGDPKGMTRMELEANASVLIGAGKLFIHFHQHLARQFTENLIQAAKPQPRRSPQLLI